jgi:hypothetical protein
MTCNWQQCRAVADNGGGWEGARQRMMAARQCKAATDDDAVVVGGVQQWQRRGCVKPRGVNNGEGGRRRAWYDHFVENLNGNTRKFGDDPD